MSKAIELPPLCSTLKPPVALSSDEAPSARTRGTLRAEQISGLSKRANERAVEAESEFGVQWDQACGCGPPLAFGGHEVGSSIRDAAAEAKAFDKLVAEVEESLDIGVSTVHAIRRGETIETRIGPRVRKHYKVLLPTRPTLVTVALTVSSGNPPTLSGHTSCGNGVIKPRGCKLKYEHAFRPGGDDGEGGERGIDRREAVPPCKELFVTAEGGYGECVCTLSVHFTKINIVLTRDELRSQVERIHKTWKVRIAEFHQTPELQDQFKQRLEKIREGRQQAKVSNDVNFPAINKELLIQWSPRNKLVRLQRHALLRCERQEQATQLRLRAEEASEAANAIAAMSRRKMADLRDAAANCCVASSRPLPALELQHAGTSICHGATTAEAVPALLAA